MFRLVFNFNFAFSALSKFFVINSNRLLCKSSCGRNLFLFPKKCFTSSYSVHYVINSIKSWDTNISYFLNLNILRSFDIVNHNRLKNIFCKRVKDTKFWLEINKMMLVGLLDFSGDLIYKKQDFLKVSLLSSFLLDVYLSELDFFLKDLSVSFGSKFNLYDSSRSSNLDLERRKYNISLKNFISIKLEKNISEFSTLNKFSLFKSQDIFSILKISSFNSSLRSFDKGIYFIRYLHHLLIGIIGSKNFSITVKNKIHSFLESDLHFAIYDFSFLSKLDSFIFFLGFNIKFSVLKDNMDSFSLNLKKNQKYKRKVLSRLDFYRCKMSKLYINRVQSELFFNIIRILRMKNIFYSSREEQKTWTYIFQLESVRCSQFSSLILNEEKFSLLSTSIFSEIRTSKFIIYQKYLFNLYLKKLSFILKEVIETFPAMIDKSIIPIDLSVNLLFDEFNKRLIFLYENFNLSYHKTSIILKNASRHLDSFVEINVPIKYVFEKLRLLGFIHPVKKRPIGNVKFLFCEDVYIVKHFGYLANSFLYWFRICDNFFMVKMLIEYIRQSCFLTLCRKHNKNKSWAYSIYTPNLLISRNLYIRQSFFPSRRSLSSMQKRFFIERDFYFDEDFLIN